MTELVLTRSGGLFDRVGAPAAGESALRVAQITVAALRDLKLRAGAASVFNDLQTLARENQADVVGDDRFRLAQRFLLALPSSIPPPELDLHLDGEVTFDWKGKHARLLTVSLRDDGRLSYAARISAYDKEHGTKPFGDAIPKVVLALVHQVTGT